MKILLTGITGNLGYEIADDLIARGSKVVPIVRPGKGDIFSAEGLKFEEVVESDLVNGPEIDFSGKADCIIHCAGIVHFKNAGNANEKMVLKVIGLAERLQIPLYFISTAFVYRPPEAAKNFNNSYEEDKWRAEEALIASGIPHTIFRPSILVGNSQTGRIQNFNGYYLVVRALLSAVNNLRTGQQKLRFPRLTGKTNMVTIDQAAQSINNKVRDGQLGHFFVTNPNPPIFAWVLEQTLELTGIRDNIDLIDCSFEEFSKLDLTETERKLYQFTTHFNPYWSIAYNFPDSICAENLIDRQYLAKTLDYFRNSQDSSNEQANY